MNDAWIWLGMAGVLVILEIFSGTFYLLMIAVGMLAGALAAWAGWSNPLQMLAVAVVGATATLLLLLRRRGSKLPQRDAANDPNVNLDIGQPLQVPHWQGSAPGPWHARVNYRGALWDVELAPGSHPQPGMYIIREVHGSRLLVSAPDR